MMSLLLRRLPASIVLLAVPVAAFAQEVTDVASSAPARVRPSMMSPFFSGTIFTSYIWWGAVVLGGVFGVVVLQRFLNK